MQRPLDSRRGGVVTLGRTVGGAHDADHAQLRLKGSPPSSVHDEVTSFLLDLFNRQRLVQLRPNKALGTRGRRKRRQQSGIVSTTLPFSLSEGGVAIAALERVRHKVRTKIKRAGKEEAVRERRERKEATLLSGVRSRRRA